MHEGAPKTWYGVSAAHAAQFESTFAEAFPTGVSKDPEIMLRKAAMVPPWYLAEHGVPLCRAVQRPGQFVVTLPQGETAAEIPTTRG